MTVLFVPESGLDCLIDAMTVLYVPESGLDCLIYTMTVLYMPESGLDCLILPRLSYICQNLALTLLYVPYSYLCPRPSPGGSAPRSRQEYLLLLYYSQA